MSVDFLHFTRGGHVENIHRGDFVATDADGKIIASLGDPHLPMFWRSAAKPFQALEFVKLGGIEKYGITQEELAFLVASHSGEPLHVDLTRSVLKKIGLDETYLNCGSAKPMSSKAANAIIAAGQKFQAVHNPCSGKHSQILALCQMLGFPTDGYIEPDHEAQKIIFKRVAWASRMDEDKLEIGIDGCGVPVFYLPISNMSTAYARLTTPSKGDWGEYEDAARTIRDAMIAHPMAMAGTGRIDVTVSEITNGRIVAKIGSDGVYCMGVKDENIGITFKIESGAYAAVTPAVIGVLKHLDLLTKEQHEALLKRYPPVLKNHRGDIIGTIETVI